MKPHRGENMIKKTILITVVILLVIGATNFKTPAVPGPIMDSCAAAMVGHRIAVYNYNECRAQDPQPLCLGEYTVMYYAMNEVLRLCFGVIT